MTEPKLVLNADTDPWANPRALVSPDPIDILEKEVTLRYPITLGGQSAMLTRSTRSGNQVHILASRNNIIVNLSEIGDLVAALDRISTESVK